MILGRVSGGVRWGVIGVGGVLLAACFSGSSGSSGSASGRVTGKPNIIVILADDLGYSDLSAFGSEIRTPNIDQLASDGRVLTNFHSTPLCATTRANLLAGADHHLVGLGRMSDVQLPYQRDQPGYEGHFNDKARTFAQLLQDAGYHTYMAGKWHLGSDGPTAWGFEHAFSLRGDMSHANNFTAPAGRSNAADPEWHEDGQVVSVPEGVFSTDLYVDKLISYIDAGRRDGRPFLAYFTPQAVHWPIQAPDRDLDRYKGVYDVGYASIRDQRLARQKTLGIIPADFVANPGEASKTLNLGLPGPVVARDWTALTPFEQQQEARSMEVFAGMLSNLDDNIGRLITHLKQVGEYDNTVIVFLSDNGADGLGFPIPVRGFLDNSLANYGKQGSFIYRSARWGEVGSTPFRLFKGFSSEGGISVPAIVRFPGAGHASAHVDALANVLDIAPTILQLAGLPPPGDSYRGRVVAPLEGRSLLAALRDPAAKVHDADEVIADEIYNHRYVRRGDWKLTRLDAGPGGNGALLDSNWQLYNIAADRGETTPLATRSVSTLPVPGGSGDAEHQAIIDTLLTDWQAYVQRVGVALPPLQQ